MPYKITCLHMRNFKCFDNKKFYSFAIDNNLNPIILSGPNGFGKTTFFDAIELIFTKNITRLYEDIEDGRINLGKNILLNEANNDGVLVLNLVDQNNSTITILTLIDHENEKLSIGKSIKYSVTDQLLNSQKDIELFLQNQTKWEISLSSCISLKYSLEHFNVYYYVSQAESVHFLKKSINERKSSVNALLKTDIIDNHIDYIEHDLIGGSIQKKGVIINDAINLSKTNIDKKVVDIKSKMKETNLGLQNTEYEQLLNYNDNTSLLLWDTKDVDFHSTDMSMNLADAIQEVQSLHSFIINKKDYENYLENQKIQKLVSNKMSIDDFIRYYSFLNNGSINCDLIKQSSLINRKKIDVFNRSNFFRKELDISIFNKEDLIHIKELDDSLISSNIDDISNSIISIVEINKELSSNQKLLNELDKARQELHKYSKAIDSTSSCPYCDHQFECPEKLEEAFSSLSTRIAEKKTIDLEKVNEKQQELKTILHNDKQKVLDYIDGLDEQIVRSLNLSITQDQQFADSIERVNTVERICTYIYPDNSWLSLNDAEKPLVIERILQEKVINYVNPDFTSYCEKYDYEKVAKKFKEILSLKQDRLTQKECIDKKINYLKYKYSLAEKGEIRLLISELKNEMIKKHKLEFIRDRLDVLKTLYKNSIDAYRNQVIKKLRIPLLVYSGKILQDYQNGLGVFVSKDEMRFVSNGDAKHDILNTFSSGQLSGFVLAFLFAMNKQYVTKSNDDLGFILVDDPVQTMDDINIASLIEVLRNDFTEKQIILSTHETDKENYILYKFLKYNLKGQSFNVKERLYL